MLLHSIYIADVSAYAQPACSRAFTRRGVVVGILAARVANVTSPL